MADSKISFWERVFRSIVDFKFYKTILGDKISKSLGYLAKLVLIIAVFLSIRILYGKFTSIVIYTFYFFG